MTTFIHHDINNDKKYQLWDTNVNKSIITSFVKNVILIIIFIILHKFKNDSKIGNYLNFYIFGLLFLSGIFDLLLLYYYAIYKNLFIIFSSYTLLLSLFFLGLDNDISSFMFLIYVFINSFIFIFVLINKKNIYHKLITISNHLIFALEIIFNFFVLITMIINFYLYKANDNFYIKLIKLIIECIQIICFIGLLIILLFSEYYISTTITIILFFILFIFILHNSKSCIFIIIGFGIIKIIYFYLKIYNNFSLNSIKDTKIWNDYIPYLTQYTFNSDNETQKEST